jgi:hypothetical protein
MKLFIQVKTKARQEKVERIDDTHYRVSTSKIPEKGKANEDIIKLLAKHFSIHKSLLTIISGKTSKVKIVHML